MRRNFFFLLFSERPEVNIGQQECAAWQSLSCPGKAITRQLLEWLSDVTNGRSKAFCPFRNGSLFEAPKLSISEGAGAFSQNENTAKIIVDSDAQINNGQ